MTVPGPAPQRPRHAPEAAAEHAEHDHSAHDHSAHGRHDHDHDRGHPAHAHRGHAHDHAHHAPLDLSQRGARRALGAALGLTATFMAVEVVVGLWSGSLALLADAGHMLNDTAALALSLVVAVIAARPRTSRHTYGYRRAEVMGALANAVALGAAGLLVIHEAVGRLADPPSLRAEGLLGTAIAGLVVNLVAAALLARHRDASINLRAALFHVIGDALGSVAAIVAGVVVLVLGWEIADPIASLFIALLILFGAGHLLRDATAVLMEAAPGHLDVEALERTIRETEGVADMHDLHVWALVPGVPVLSAHVVLREGAHGTDVARLVGVRLKAAHGVGHATIQPESPPSPLVELRRK